MSIGSASLGRHRASREFKSRPAAGRSRETSTADPTPSSGDGSARLRRRSGRRGPCRSSCCSRPAGRSAARRGPSPGRRTRCRQPRGTPADRPCVLASRSRGTSGSAAGRSAGPSRRRSLLAAREDEAFAAVAAGEGPVFVHRCPSSAEGRTSPFRSPAPELSRRSRSDAAVKRRRTVLVLTARRSVLGGTGMPDSDDLSRGTGNRSQRLVVLAAMTNERRSHSTRPALGAATALALVLVAGCSPALQLRAPPSGAPAGAAASGPPSAIADPDRRASTIRPAPPTCSSGWSLAAVSCRSIHGNRSPELHALRRRHRRLPRPDGEPADAQRRDVDSSPAPHREAQRGADPGDARRCPQARAASEPRPAPVHQPGSPTPRRRSSRSTRAGSSKTVEVYALGMDAAGAAISRAGAAALRQARRSAPRPRSRRARSRADVYRPPRLPRHPASRASMSVRSSIWPWPRLKPTDFVSPPADQRVPEAHPDPGSGHRARHQGRGHRGRLQGIDAEGRTASSTRSPSAPCSPTKTVDRPSRAPSRSSSSRAAGRLPTCREIASALRRSARRRRTRTGSGSSGTRAGSRRWARCGAWRA